MKRNYLYCLIVFQSLLILSCLPSGNLFLESVYEYVVFAHTTYDYNNTIFERFDDFKPGVTVAVAGRHIQYSHIIAIRIETKDGEILAEYSPEYIESLRKIYVKKKNQKEIWIFGEKGLFFYQRDIRKRYNGDYEKVLAYYRSDEAVQDLQSLLNLNPK